MNFIDFVVKIDINFLSELLLLLDSCKDLNAFLHIAYRLPKIREIGKNRDFRANWQLLHVGLPLNHEFITDNSMMVKIHDICWNTNSSILATGDYRGMIRFWNDRGCLLNKFVAHPKTWVSCLAWSHSNILASSGNENGRGIIKLWTSDGQPHCASIKDSVIIGHTDWIKSLSWSPNNILASSSYDRTIRLWTDQGISIGPILGHVSSGIIECVAWSPRNILASANDTDIILFTNLQSNESESQMIVMEITGTMHLAWSRNNVLASSHHSGKIHLWNTNGMQLTILSGHNDWIRCLAWNFETDVLASAGDDGSIKLWKNESPHIFVLGSPLLQYNWIRKIAWNHKKNILAFDDNKDNAVVLKQSK